MQLMKWKKITCLVLIFSIFCSVVFFMNSTSNASDFWDSLGIKHMNQINKIKFYQSLVAGDMNLIPSNKAMRSPNNSSDLELLFDCLSHTTSKPNKTYNIDGFQLQNPMLEVDTVTGTTIRINWDFDKGEIQVGDDIYYISKKYAVILYDIFLKYHDYRGGLAM